MQLTNEQVNKILDIVLNCEDEEIRCYEEDFVADDFAGGNIDDAWSGGFDDGYNALAHEIIAIIKENN